MVQTNLSRKRFESEKPLASTATRSAPRVLMLGYNGANNTGAEALLLADIEDVRAVLGPQAVITVPCINPPNLRRYLKEAPNLRIAPMPTIFSARAYNASKMTSILRSLDFLVTARYHACVLSSAAQVPQIAVGHDLRLKSIYAELGLQDLFVDARLPSRDADLRAKLDRVLADPEPVRAALRRGYREHLNKARCNRRLLEEFVRAQGWEPAPGAPVPVREAA